MQPPSHQPLTFSFRELLYRTFSIYRENFATIIGLVAFVTIPISLLTIIISPQPLTALTAQAGDAADGGALLVNLLSLLESILVTAPLIYLVSESLFNRKVTIGEAFGSLSHRFSQIGCGVLLVGFSLGFLALLIIFLVIAFPPALGFAGIGLHIIVTTSALMFPVLTLEKISPAAALSRSWSLGKRRFWAVVSVGLLIVVVSLVASSLIAAGIGILVGTAIPNINVNLQFLLVSVVSDLIGIFITPISPIAFTLMYYDIRTRTEALDTQLESPSTRPIDLVSPINRFQFDRHDWRNIAILSVIGLVIGIVGNNFIQQVIQQLTPGLR